jgi:LysR family nitrogen assimilation transcriptional regulator
VESAFLAAGVTPNITFEIDGVPAILDLVADGAGNAVLTKHAVKSSFRPSAFITKSFKEPKIQIPVTLATSSRRPSTQIQIKTIELLKRIVVENIQKVF